MNFEEMKKIWDTQNDEHLYAINEEALHQHIKSKKYRAERLNNINDFGLIAVGIITAIVYSFLSIVNETPTLYDYLIVVAMLCITGYVWYGRIRRRKQKRNFAHTILGDLDHAIANVNYEVNRSKNMVWWFVLPLAILVLLNMSQENIPLWKWIGIGAMFVLSALLVRWELNSCHKPKKQQLMVLKKKLTQETTA